MLGRKAGSDTCDGNRHSPARLLDSRARKGSPSNVKMWIMRLTIKDLVRSRYRQLEIKTRSMRVVRRGPKLTAV